MEIDKIKKKLKSSKYDFLKTTEGLKENIILLTLGGSYAYGTNVPTSDLDVRGVTANSRREILTMNCRCKPYENQETDTVIYPLQQLKGLLINANPNTLEILGTKDEHLFILTKEGKMLRDNTDLFLSQKAIYSFGGYATSQLRRLQNALVRDDYPLHQKEEHILENLKKQFSTIEDRYKELTNENLKLYLDDSSKKDYEKEIFLDITLKNYPLRDFANIYSEMMQVVRNYDKLNSRNKKKDDTHLNKHAMHLVRLLIMGTEILEGKGVNTYREKDRKLLLKLRNGDFVIKKNDQKDYSAVFDVVDRYEEKFRYAIENTSLPREPDYNKIDELIMEINLMVINK